MISVYLARVAQIQDDPGFIVGPISHVFGYVIDFIFNIVYGLTTHHSLGLSLIFLTIIVRFLMLPMFAKQQKSMMKMQQLNPEIQKIRDKYGKTKDPEIQQKMNVEIQAVYSKNKVNPLGGCLPMLITMPLFFGLSYIMNQSYMFISKLGGVYRDLAAQIYACIDPNIHPGVDPQFFEGVKNLALPYVPQKMLDAQSLNISVPDQFAKILNKFNTDSWEALFAQIGTYAPDNLSGIRELFTHKEAIETFFSLSLTNASGWSWPGILIPLLTGLTTLLSSWLSTQMTTVTDERSRTTQRTMMIVMPVMMAVMTVGMPAGVGLYWITSSVFQVVQQVIMNSRSGIPFKLPFIGGGNKPD